MDDAFRTRLVSGTLIVLLLFGLALLVVQMSGMLLLIFAAVLVGVLITAAAMPFRKLGLSRTPAVLLGVLAILALLGLAGWLFGTRINAELSNVADQLPGAIETARGWLDAQPFGEQLASATPDLQGLAGRAMGFAFGAIGAVTNLVLVLIGAIYLALQPKLYVKGVQNIFPRKHSVSIEHALNTSGRALHLYLLGQLFTMAFVGTLVAVGLSLVGVPSAMALGLIVGLANFVPLIGPFIGAVPGILLALVQGPQVALYAGLVYLVAQQLEGNVLTPLVQRHAVSIPPALLIFALAGLGTLFGTMGVILAAPLAVVIYTMVTMLWSRDTLEHDVTVPGER